MQIGCELKSGLFVFGEALSRVVNGNASLGGREGKRRRGREEEEEKVNKALVCLERVTTTSSSDLCEDRITKLLRCEGILTTHHQGATTLYL